MIRMNTDIGQITVDSAVYTNIAGFAATNCFGVKGMAVGSMGCGFTYGDAYENASGQLTLTYKMPLEL